MNSLYGESASAEPRLITTEQAREQAERIEAEIYPDLDEVIRSHGERIEEGARAEWYYRRFGQLITKCETVDESVFVFDGTNVLEFWSKQAAAQERAAQSQVYTV
jgi:hypothetical protein